MPKLVRALLCPASVIGPNGIHLCTTQPRKQRNAFPLARVLECAFLKLFLLVVCGYYADKILATIDAWRVRSADR